MAQMLVERRNFSLALLIGATENAIDPKGRLVLAAKWRTALASGVIITRGFDQCLFIFPLAQFEKLARAVDTLGIASSIVRAFARHLVALAEYAELDQAGRLSLPPKLCQFAELNSIATVVGVINHLEVWNPQKFAEVNSQGEENAPAVAEKFGALMRRPIADAV